MINSNHHKHAAMSRSAHPLPLERRRFLKLGFTITGIFLGGSLLSLVPEAAAQNRNILEKIGPVVGSYPYKPHYSMAIRLNRCIDCELCLDACASNNHVPTYGYRLAILHRPKQIGHLQATEFLPVLCNQCNNPPCVKVCPTKATIKDKTTGIILTDDKLCIGCKTCMTACPYNARYFNNEKHAVDKCDFCYQSRLSGGTVLPACVEACPADVFLFGDLADKESALYRLLHTQENKIWALRPETGSLPNVFYVEN